MSPTSTYGPTSTHGIAGSLAPATPPVSPVASPWADDREANRLDARLAALLCTACGTYCNGCLIGGEPAPMPSCTERCSQSFFRTCC